MELLRRWNPICKFTLILSAAAVLALEADCVRRAPAAYQVEREPRSLVSATDTSSPRLTVSSSGMLSLLVAYREGEATRLGFSMSHDGGDDFMPVIPISSPAASVSSHGESSPMLASVPTAIYALWQQDRNQLLLARSLNFGRSFDPPVRVDDGPREAFRGFASLAASPGGHPFVVWLDGRDKDNAPDRFSLYLAHSEDRGATFLPNEHIGTSACPCCRPALTFGAQGQVYVAWRKVFSGDVRDMVVSTSLDNGRTFSSEIRVADDGWSLRGCPDSGPTLAASQKRLYIAWLTEGRDRRPRIQLSWSEDNAQHFHTPVEVSGNVLDPNHPALILSEDGNLALVFQGRSAADGNSWNPSSIFVVRIQAERVSAPQVLPNGNAPASNPSGAAGTGGRLFISWTEQTKTGRRAVLLRARRQGS